MIDEASRKMAEVIAGKGRGGHVLLTVACGCLTAANRIECTNKE
jgi:hypothetical protein